MNIGSTQMPVDVPVVTPSRSASTELTAKPDPVVAPRVENPPAAAQPVDRDRVEQAAVVLQEFAQSIRRDINFRVDDGSGKLVIKVTDLQSGDLIRQIPSEEALQIAENLDAVRSKLFSAEA